MPKTTLNTIIQYFAIKIHPAGFLVFIAGFFVSIFISFHNPRYSFLLYLCAAFFALLEVYTLYVAIQQRVSGTLIIRQQKRSLNYMLLLTSLLYTVNYFLNRQHTQLLPFLICFYILALADIAMYYLYRHFKPIAFVIGDASITIPGKGTSTFDIAGIASIKLNTMEDAVSFKFSDKTAFDMKINEFSRADILQLVVFCVSTQKEVSVHPLVYTALQPPLAPLPFFRRIGRTIKNTLLP